MGRLYFVENASKDCEDDYPEDDCKAHKDNGDDWKSKLHLSTVLFKGSFTLASKGIDFKGGCHKDLGNVF